MNEVTKIHLGRQAYTIAADAYTELRKYLDAIAAQVKDTDVVEEVELRMSELLSEHGITADSVILAKDVTLLKEQLGNPKDFTDNDTEAADADKDIPRRLFRDTSSAWIAGVSSGLAQYSGINVWVVRALFIIGALSGAWGIVLYLALWLLVPEAKTSSDKLQMLGKPVTIDSLKEVVARADVAGATKRVNQSFGHSVLLFCKIVLAFVGIIFIVTGLSVLLAAVVGETYVLLHPGQLLGQTIFPVGFREHLLLGIALAATALLSSWIVVAGVAMIKRRWPLKSWITGVMTALTVVCMVGTAVLATDIVPQIQKRYEANVHTTVRTVPAFTSVKVVDSPNVSVNYETGTDYSVSMKYYDHPDIKTIKTTVTDSTLLVDSAQFDGSRDCPSICVPDEYTVDVTVRSPQAVTVEGVPTLEPPHYPETPMSAPAN